MNPTNPLARISVGKPWTLFALALAAGIFVYFSFLAFGFWTSYRAVETLTARIGQLEYDLAEPLPPAELLSAEQDRREAHLAGLVDTVRDPGTAELMGFMSELAAEAGLELSAMTAGEAWSSDEDEAGSQVQPVRVDLRGPLLEQYRFLELINERSAAVSAKSLRIIGAGDAPSVQLDLLFTYLAPDSGQEE